MPCRPVRAAGCQWMNFGNPAAGPGSGSGGPGGSGYRDPRAGARAAPPGGWPGCHDGSDRCRPSRRVGRRPGAAARASPGRRAAGRGGGGIVTCRQWPPAAGRRGHGSGTSRRRPRPLAAAPPLAPPRRPAQGGTVEPALPRSRSAGRRRRGLSGRQVGAAPAPRPGLRGNEDGGGRAWPPRPLRPRRAERGGPGEMQGLSESSRQIGQNSGYGNELDTCTKSGWHSVRLRKWPVLYQCIGVYIA
jgi:hypothetical protein